MSGVRTSADGGAGGAGLALCLLAAAGFAAAAVAGKAAERAGVDLVSLLALRFGLAALLLWAVVAGRGAPRPGRRTVVAGLLLGAGVFAPESGLFFASLTRLDASVAGLVVYVYPALVAVGAVALGRERLTRRRLAALAGGSGGVALVLAGSGAGSVDGLGVLLALGAALAYATYVLASDVAVRGSDALTLAALVCSGAALSFTAVGAGRGTLDPGAGGTGWAFAGLLAVAATVVPMAALLGGIARVGPSTAGIVSTAEPVLTAAMAVAIVGERLAPAQWLGAALVVGAVALLRARWRTGRRRAQAPGPAPARAAGEGVT